MLKPMDMKEYKRKRRLRFSSRLFGKFLSLITHQVLSYQLRNSCYRLMGVKLGRSEIYIGRDCLLDDEYPELITIEDGVCISFRVTIVAHDAIRGIVAPVHIKRKAFLGACSLILPGVVIGEEAVVAAGSVVTKDVEPYTVVGGVPAVKIKDKDKLG
jgi:acetyltransferase-like isoleucine patch superfamily enzyme